MFANTQMVTINLAFPDVCLTPIVVTVPIPYPNIALNTMAVPTVYNHFIEMMPVHNQLTTVTISLGDNAGVSLGVASGLFMGPRTHLMGSVKVFFSVMPATKMLSPTMQNGASPNMVGSTLSPSQVKVIILT